MGRKRLKPWKSQLNHVEAPKCKKQSSDGLDADKHSPTTVEHTECQSDRKKIVSKQEKIVSVEKDGATTQDIFPHWFPWILFPLTLSVRILYVLEPTNWWILHPDEIFQTIEVAHSDRYGYGFRAYEYLPPPGNDVINSTTLSSAHAQEIALGMYSLRSFILPKLLSSVMLLANTCSINTSPYRVIKMFHVILTSLLPVIIFQFSRRLYRSRDIACLSAVLISSSLSLNVFGTHTIINSFLSPFLFISLVPLVNLLKSVEQSDLTESKDAPHSSPSASSNPGADTESLEERVPNGAEVAVANGKIPHKHTAELKRSSSEQPQATFSSHDENANIVFLKERLSNLHAMNYCGFENGSASSSMVDGYRTKIHIQVPRCGDIIEVLNMYEAFAAFGLALCIYIRVDLILIPLLLICCFCHHVFGNISKFLTSIKSYLLGLVTGILIGGYCDYVTYGSWFLSPYQWYQFNVGTRFAGGIFGVSNCSFYVLKLYQNEPLVILSFTILLIDILINVSLRFTRNAFTANVHSHSAKNQSFAIFVLLLLAFSLNGHKELRFMHDAIIFMYIAVARALFVIHDTTKKLRNQNNCQYSIYSVYIFIVLFVSSHCYYFLDMRFEDRTKWTYARNIDSHETNTCLDFIRQQKDVRGVFMDRSLQMSGAYSVLHQDVPIFALNMFEYMEYKQPVRSKILNNQDLNSMKMKGFSTFTDIADFISIRNSQYLLKTLILKSEYNFLILRTNQDFIQVGYEEVFREGKSKVLKRKLEEQSEVDLKIAANKIQIYWNATILEYEGDWLKHFGLYTKAEKRLMMANRVDPRRIGTFRILIDMYRKLKNMDNYTSVLNACQQLYKKSYCLEPYVPLMIHRGYYRKMR